MAKLLVANPRRRTTKRKPRRKTSKGLVTQTRRTTTVTRRRNPARRQRTGVMNQVQNAAVGAAGALAVDVAMAKLPFIPENLKSGPVASATKGAVAVAIGMAVEKFGKNKRLGVQLAEGGLTVALHEAAKGMIGPAMGLGQYEYDMAGLGDYSDLLNDPGFQGFETMNGFETVDGFSGEAF